MTKLDSDYCPYHNNRLLVYVHVRLAPFKRRLALESFPAPVKIRFAFKACALRDFIYGLLGVRKLTLYIFDPPVQDVFDWPHTAHHAKDTAEILSAYTTAGGANVSEPYRMSEPLRRRSRVRADYRGNKGIFRGQRSSDLNLIFAGLWHMHSPALFFNVSSMGFLGLVLLY